MSRTIDFKIIREHQYYEHLNNGGITVAMQRREGSRQYFLYADMNLFGNALSTSIPILTVEQAMAMSKMLMMIASDMEEVIY